jgi:hypothetical protein
MYAHAPPFAIARPSLPVASGGDMRDAMNDALMSQGALEKAGFPAGESLRWRTIGFGSAADG